MRRDLLEGGAAVVTGGARGIGGAIAKRIVDAGGHVVIADLDADRGQELARRLGDRASSIAVDVTDPPAIDAVFAHAERLCGRVTAVFANAGGVGARGPLADTSMDGFRGTVDLLFTSVFLAFRAGIRAMLPHGAGSLVATGSVAGTRGGLGPHIYTAAKHAVHGLVASTASEVTSWGLTANVVAPGGTVSGLSAALYGDADDTDRAYARLARGSASGVPTTSDDVAEAALFLAYGTARVNGACLVVDGGDAVLGTAGRSYHQAPQEGNGR